MNAGKKQMAAVLTGAVVLASGAYAVGSQSGQGSGTAGGVGTASERGVRHGPVMASLASRLGVDPAKLRSALAAMRTSKQASGDPGAQFAAQFAKALGLPQAKVKAALLQAGIGPPEAMLASALAKELGLDPVKVQSALDKVRPMGPPPGRPGRFRGRVGPGGLAGALAKELGVNQSKVQGALDKLRANRPMGAFRGPGRPFGRPGVERRGRFGGDGPPPPGLLRRGAFAPPAGLVSKLAKALGVSDAKVRTAVGKLRAGRQARVDAFASELAQRLGLPVAKVKAALGAFGPHGGRPGP
jgi:hypothetical protein